MMISRAHLKRDFARTNYLPTVGFEPMTFALGFPCQGITFLAEILSVLDCSTLVLATSGNILDSMVRCNVDD